MKPVKFKQVNLTLAENQPEYQPLPVQYNDEAPDGPMCSCWELDDAEIAQIIKTKRVFLKQLTFHSPFQPIHPTIYNPYEAIEVPYYQSNPGLFVAHVPLMDGSHDVVNGLNLASIIDDVCTRYMLSPENLAFVLIDKPDKVGIIPA